MRQGKELIEGGKKIGQYTLVVRCLATEARDQFQVYDSLYPKGPGSLIAANYSLKGPSYCYTSAPDTLADVCDDM